MKLLNAFIISCFIISIGTVSYCQKFTTGIYSGINFSDIHGQDINGKWNAKPGPVQGLYLGYSFNRSFGLQTGINYFSIYYDRKTTASPIIFDKYLNYSLTQPYYFVNEKMDFTFLRIPLLFTVTIPSALQFDMRAGLFFSFLQNYSLNSNLYYYPPSEEKPEKTDFGYIFSSGISYPVSDHFKASFNAGYMTGRKRFLNDLEYRHGSSEFTFGFAYTGFHNNKNAGIALNSGSDSTKSKIEVIFRGGMNYSWNSGFRFRNEYSPGSGPSFGFYLNFPMKYKTSFQTGLLFERKGYSLKDSSALFYRYSLNKFMMYDVDTKVQLDYAVIPALINFLAGRHGNVFINTGPWLALKLNARTVGVAYDESRTGTNYVLRKTVVYDDLEKIVNDYDIGWIFGGGISVPVFNSYSIDLALQYSAGFREVFDKSGLTNLSGPGSTSVIKNGTVSFLIGLKLPSADQ
jgi:hypothetical protein